jgi:hypothetical protein
VLPSPRSSVEGTSSQLSFSSSSSTNSCAAAAMLPGFRNPEAESSSSIRTFRIFRGAGMMVYWSGSGRLAYVAGYEVVKSILFFACDLVMMRSLTGMINSPLTRVWASRGSFNVKSFESAITLQHISTVSLMYTNNLLLPNLIVSSKVD